MQMTGKQIENKQIFFIILFYKFIDNNLVCVITMLFVQLYLSCKHVSTDTKNNDLK